MASQYQPAVSEVKLQWLIHVAAALSQDVLTDDAQIGGAVFHVDGHIG